MNDQAIGSPGSADKWMLRLYIAGQTPKSVLALANLKKLCEEQLPGRYQLEVIDLMEHPERAKADQIVAIPTLVRKLPEPLKRMIGDLSTRIVLSSGWTSTSCDRRRSP